MCSGAILSASVGTDTAQVERSRAREMQYFAKNPQRSGPPASAICAEPKGGSDKKSKREEEEERPKKGVPQHILSGSNPAWAPPELGKLPVARLESDARRLVNGRSRMRKGRVEREEKAEGTLQWMQSGQKINHSR